MYLNSDEIVPLGRREEGRLFADVGDLGGEVELSLGGEEEGELLRPFVQALLHERLRHLQCNSCGTIGTVPAFLVLSVQF